jgi:hypothetical protein
MLVLAMTALGFHQIPAIFFNQLDYVANFHHSSTLFVLFQKYRTFEITAEREDGDLVIGLVLSKVEG